MASCVLFFAQLLGLKCSFVFCMKTWLATVLWYTLKLNGWQWTTRQWIFKWCICIKKNGQTLQPFLRGKNLKTFTLYPVNKEGMWTLCNISVPLREMSSESRKNAEQTLSQYAYTHVAFILPAKPLVFNGCKKKL